MIFVLDNYDSFTYNLWHFLGELGAEVQVRRNDALTAAEALALKPQGVILSPGPCDPERAGICLDLVKQAPDSLPILGVCLGHQTIGQAFGGTVARGEPPMHGKVSAVDHQGTGVFRGLPSPFAATRYHSLVVLDDGLPETLAANARTEDGTIMGLHHVARPVHGVQFHPESIASEHGHALLRNFLEIATGTPREAA